MKKILLFSVLTIMAFALTAQEYVDLGLSSGTKWKSENEAGFVYNYTTAVLEHGDNMPTIEQFRELTDSCEWKWNNNGYTITGPNGNSIFLPAEGFRSCSGDIENEGTFGSYWSLSVSSLDRAWALYFSTGRIGVGDPATCTGRSVRLVQNR